MKLFVRLYLLATFLMLQAGCGSKAPTPIVPDPPQQEHQEQDETNKSEDTMPSEIKITVSGKSLPVKIEDNDATKALVAALRESSISYEAHDYGGFEKVGALGLSLPANDTQITTQPGDVILYSGNQIVLFYGSNSWSYTRLGRIEYSSQAELESFLKAGQGNITVKLSLSSDASSISNVRNASDDEGVFYSLNGLRVKNPSKGIYIKNGKKVAL